MRPVEWPRPQEGGVRRGCVPYAAYFLHFSFQYVKRRKEGRKIETTAAKHNGHGQHSCQAALQRQQNHGLIQSEDNNRSDMRICRSVLPLSISSHPASSAVSTYPQVFRSTAFPLAGEYSHRIIPLHIPVIPQVAINGHSTLCTA